jgi:4-alpha-glucanotransferase
VTTTPKKPSPARSAGVLLHPTSLPGPYGIGDLGPAAYGWVDALVRARQTWWQVLPLGPTGYGDSPYQAFSAFAGNPYLVSPEVLLQEGLLNRPDLEGAHFPPGRVDYGPAIAFKVRVLGRAWENFRRGSAPALQPAFEEFCVKHAAWLDDFALFMALKDANAGRGWHDWPTGLVLREPGAVRGAHHELAYQVGQHKFRQFLFSRQWGAVRQYARERGIRLIGDLPIFVSADSADVWANPHLFLLDERRRPTVVAGVPPDYFSATGQLWGNPLYNWERLRQTGYAWWLARVRAALEQVDLVRLDHFRGFESYWEVPAGAPTAQGGRWVKAPGAELFERLRAALGGLPFIAEDLGLITPEVEALREKFAMPGMRILQFAFGGGPENRYLPHHYDRNTAVYTGTHDNDTTAGWFGRLAEHERAFVRRYVPQTQDGPAWDFLRLAWSSVADYALAPLQDVLGLGNEARMNLPGQAAGNWSWRYNPETVNDHLVGRMREMTELYSREPD